MLLEDLQNLTPSPHSRAVVPRCEKCAPGPFILVVECISSTGQNNLMQSSEPAEVTWISAVSPNAFAAISAPAATRILMHSRSSPFAAMFKAVFSSSSRRHTQDESVAMNDLTVT